MTDHEKCIHLTKSEFSGETLDETKKVFHRSLEKARKTYNRDFEDANFVVNITGDDSAKVLSSASTVKP